MPVTTVLRLCTVRHQNLFLAKSEQLPGKRPLGHGILDLDDVISTNVVLGHAPGAPGRCSRKWPSQIVKIVSYAARQYAYGFHLLSLKELLLEVLPLGNVLYDRQHIAIRHHRCDDFGFKYRPVFRRNCHS